MTTTAPQSRFATGGTAKTGAAGSSAAATVDGANGAATKGRGPKKGGIFKSKKFLIILVAVLALGGGAYTFLMPTKAVPPTGGEVVQMDPMTLNLAGGHYLKVAAAIQLVKGKATATDFSTSHAAELLIDQFSNRPVVSLSTNEARKKLTADLLAALKKAYPGEVYQVFLTQFVTQ